MSDYEIYPFEETMDALFEIKRQHEAGEELKWTGPDRLHHSVSAGNPEPSWTFSPEGLAYHEDHGRNFEQVWAMIVFQIGLSNGAVRESERTDQWIRIAERAEESAAIWRSKFKGLTD